jgi:hypothetical protein
LTVEKSIPVSFNDWVDFWRYEVGVNVIPADTKNKKTWISWLPYQNAPIPEAQHVQWKNENTFSKGMAIIPGKVWHNPQKQGLYLAFIDLDNQKAIEEFCGMDGKIDSLEKLSEHVIVERHKDDLSKAHIYCYTKHPLTKKSSDRISDLATKIVRNEIPAFEVKSLGEHGIAYCTPSPHKNGSNYEIIGTTNPAEISDLDRHIDSICKKYHIPYLDNGNKKSLTPIQDLFKTDTKIPSGHNRHEAILRVIESLIKRNKGILPLEKIKQLAWEENQRIGDPPLEQNEFERQWEGGLKFIGREELKRNGNGPSDKSIGTDTNTNITNAEILVELANNNTQEFFRDQYGIAFAVIRIVGHDEVIALESGRFKRYLSKLFYDGNNHKVISTDSVSNAIQILQAKAEYESQTIPLSLRVAWSRDKEAVYYDLTDEKWRTVIITKAGWDVITSSPILFVRYNQTPQVEPLKDYENSIFDQFLELTNIKDRNSRLLLKVYIISVLIPDIAHPMLVLYGDKGAAKSTVQTLIKKLIDPSRPTLLTVHNDRTEFIQQLAHNYVAYYDNMKYNPSWLSDESCKAVTGVGHTKRRLYSNDEDIVYEYKRCLGFNGINMNLTEPDALDRSIMIEQERIPRERRQSEINIYSKFEELQPRLLGFIFDCISKTLTIKDSLELKELPRMADFGTWGEAIARALGYAPFEFLNAYYDNIGRQNIEAVEAHPLGQAIVRLCTESEDEFGVATWYGSIGECLEKLTEIADRYRINKEAKSWPKAPNVLTRRLNQIKSNLLEGLNIEVTIDRVTRSSEKRSFNTSTVRIRKISPEPPEPPEEHTLCEKLTDFTGDIDSSGDIIPPETKIPPEISPENHAQNNISGDTGDTGGNISASVQEPVINEKLSNIELLRCPHCPFENRYTETIEHHIKFTHNERISND